MEKSVFAIPAMELRNWVLSLGDQKPVVLITRELKDEKEMLYLLGTGVNGNFDLKDVPLALEKLEDASANK